MYIRIPFTKHALSLKVEIHAEVVAGHPLGWPRHMQHKLAQEIKQSVGHPIFGPRGDIVHFQNDVVGAIKACRYLLQEQGHRGGLRESKEFVDTAFDRQTLDIIL